MARRLSVIRFSQTSTAGPVSQLSMIVEDFVRIWSKILHDHGSDAVWLANGRGVGR
jgi:hypothetical protein